MRIIVTGGLGFIGQNLAILLRRQIPRVNLLAIDTLKDPLPGERSLYDQVVGTCFADPHALHLYERADAVVHLAGEASVQASIARPLHTFETNVARTQALLEHLRHHAPRTHFVFASTGGALAGDTDGLVDETLAPSPLSPYGASKLAVEGLLSAYRGAYGLRSVALRFSNVYGPHSARKHALIAAFCRSALGSGRLQVFGDGRQTRDYVHADDIASAVALAIERRAEGTFQLGTGVATSVMEIAHRIRALRPDRGIGIDHSAPLPGEVRHSCSDISRARHALGYAPRHTLAEGLRMTLDWYESMPLAARGPMIEHADAVMKPRFRIVS